MRGVPEELAADESEQVVTRVDRLGLGIHGDARAGRVRRRQGRRRPAHARAAIEYAAQGIRVNCICPGATLTPLLYDFPGREQSRAPSWRPRCV